MTGWDFANPLWRERLVACQSLLPDGLPLDLGEAERAVAIYNRLRLPDVPGRPALATASGEWTRDIVRAIFGSLAPDGRRMISEIGALVPKKNNKTTGGAAIMLTALLMNQRPRAEFILVGPTQEIADLAFSQAAGMIDADPDNYLQTRFLVQEHIKTIVDRRTRAKLKIKTFDLKVMTGAKPAGVLVDELHLMSAMSYASRVIGQIRGGLIVNPEAFLIFITTQSDMPPAGVFKQELSYWRAVRDGTVHDARVLPILYEFPLDMQRGDNRAWDDPANWPMVLPNLGLSISLDRLVQEREAARDKGEEELRRWASQHLNVEIGIALAADAWAGARFWEAAHDPGLCGGLAGLAALTARCDVVTVGIDGGGLDDLFGLAVLGRDRHTREWLSWARAWAHPEVLERRKDIAETLRDFIRDGDLVLCDRATQDVDEAAAICADLRDAGVLPEKSGIGLDPMCVAALLDALAAREMQPDQDGGPLTSVRQGIHLSPASWGLERKLKDGTFWHSGQPLMAWCVGNAKVEQKGNAVSITKQTAGKAKIDPLIATLNSAMLMARGPEAAGVTHYEVRIF